MEEQSVSTAEIARGKHLHSVLLFDFIVIHIFIFLLALSMIKSSIIPMILMPIISIISLTYVIFKGTRTSATEPSHFVRCHMLLAAKRAKLFLGLFVVTGSFTAFILLGGAQFGMSKITSYALAGGIGQLPFMVALLVLVVLEFDAEHQCSDGKIPPAGLALVPNTTQG